MLGNPLLWGRRANTGAFSAELPVSYKIVLQPTRRQHSLRETHAASKACLRRPMDRVAQQAPAWGSHYCYGQPIRNPGSGVPCQALTAREPPPSPPPAHLSSETGRPGAGQGRSLPPTPVPGGYKAPRTGRGRGPRAGGGRLARQTCPRPPPVHSGPLEPIRPAASAAEGGMEPADTPDHRPSTLRAGGGGRLRG